MCHQNHTHKIVHSSAMYYQNLNVIHEPSKKLLTMKSVRKKILTPSISARSLHSKISTKYQPYRETKLPLIISEIQSSLLVAINTHICKSLTQDCMPSHSHFTIRSLFHSSLIIFDYQKKSGSAIRFLHRMVSVWALQNSISIHEPLCLISFIYFIYIDIQYKITYTCTCTVQVLK